MSKALEQNGAFILEYKQGDRWNTYSYYSATNINIDKDNSIVYQTKNKYNEQTIYPGDKQDTDTLFIGTIRKDDLRSFIGCHSDILLFNRTLTEYEISWVKNNLMCSKPQEPDENDILKSLVVHYNIGKQGANSIKTTSSLTDYSGNNRNATCKNFDWNTTEFVDEGKAMRFDGNGSCIVAVDMPQIDKYTLIVKRRWIDKKSENKWFCSLGSGDYTSASQSLFWFEGGLLNNVFYTYNRGYKNPIVLPELISIQSSDDYNGLHINESNAVQAGNKLFIGSVGENDNTHVTADFYQLLLFDRVLTDKEREWVKENLIEPDIISASKACGTYSINNSKTTPIFVDTNKDINTNENPSNSSISSTYVYDIEREGDLTYPEDKEECIAYGMSTSPNRLIWGDYETTEPLKFTDYITIHSGHNMLAEFYYKTDNIGYINSYILIFKKDKVTEQVYKTYIRVTKELLNSIHGVNNLLIELTYTGSIGSKWEEFDDELLYKPYIRTKGTFAQKPLSSQGIQQGFSYFCTDKQTVEGSRSGIMIYYAGNDTWVDALGRYV